MKTFLFSMLLVAAGSLAQAALDDIHVEGDQFRFAIVTDPLLDTQYNRDQRFINAQRTCEAAGQELNTLSPVPAFTVHLGDLVTDFGNHQVGNYYRITKYFDMPLVLAQGYNKGSPPHEAYPKILERVMGRRQTAYSFDVAQWHFIVLPAMLATKAEGLSAQEQALLSFLKKDLESHANQPTICFSHVPCLPVGLSQLEYDRASLALRQEIFRLLTEAGTVKYVFSGHIHAGIKAAEKCAWRYKGVTFMLCPSIAPPHPFGEEFPAFEKVQERGGYYLVVDVKGETLRVRGRAAGVDADHLFSTTIKELPEEIATRWFMQSYSLAPNKKIVNPDFSKGFEGWRFPIRYQRDHAPAYQRQILSKGSGKALQLSLKSPCNSLWAKDEYDEAAQLVACKSPNPLISLRYQIPNRIHQGGLYLRIHLLLGEKVQGMILFYGCDETSATDVEQVSQSIAYDLFGRRQEANWLDKMVEAKKALFIPLPYTAGRWHTLQADIGQLWDTAHGREGAYAELWMNQLLLVPGVFAHFNRQGQSSILIDELNLRKGPADSTIDTQPLRIKIGEFPSSPFK